MTDTIELGERDKVVPDEVTEDTDDIGETSFTNQPTGGDDLLNTSIPVTEGSNPNFQAGIPNIARDVGVIKRAFTYDKKSFINEFTGVNLRKGTQGTPLQIYYLTIWF